jgi:hypothetical protein
LDVFVSTIFLGVGFGLGFAIAFGVDIGAGFGVDVRFGVGNSISLFAAVTSGFSSSASSVFNVFGSGRGVEAAGSGRASRFVAPASISSVPLNQIRFSASSALLAATVQRINPAMSARCASAISVTFRQKRPSFDILFRLGPCSNADLGNLCLLQCVHQPNQFLHRQFAIGPNHDGHIRIGLLQLGQLRGER